MEIRIRIGMDEILAILGLISIPLSVLPWLVMALAALIEGFPRLQLRQVLGIVGVVAWVLAYVVGGENAYVLTVASVVVILLMFGGMWSHEFRLVMSRRSDEFPDRHDKLAWVFVLTVMAPAGVWLFRSYRKARWPEAIKAARPHPLDEPDPDQGVEAPGLHPIEA
jgi:hypothetical protein